MDHPWSMVISTAPEVEGVEAPMFEGNPMTKEEFLAGINEMIQDMADPNGEFQQLAVEGKEIASELRRFDPGLADKFLAVCTALDDLGTYVKGKGEFLGTHAETR